MSNDVHDRFIERCDWVFMDGFASGNWIHEKMGGRAGMRWGFFPGWVYRRLRYGMAFFLLLPLSYHGMRNA